MKLATKAPTTISTDSAEVQTVTATTVTEVNTQTPQIQTRFNDPGNFKISSDIASLLNVETATFFPSYTATVIDTTTTEATTTTTTPVPITTLAPTTTTTTLSPPTTTTEVTTTTTIPVTSITTLAPTTTTIPAPLITTTIPITTVSPTTTMLPKVTMAVEDETQYQRDAQILQQLLQGTVRDSKNLNLFAELTTTTLPVTKAPITTQKLDEAKLLQALLSATGQNSKILTNLGENLTIAQKLQTTTTRSIEDEIRQFEEDTKLLKALLQATGQNPSNFNIPTLNIKPTTNIPTAIPTTTSRTPRPTTTTTTTSTTLKPTTTTKPTTTNIDEDIKKLQEDAKLLQALLQATGQNSDHLNIPIITGVTSNVRIASNPLTTKILSNPTTPINVRPVYNSRTTMVPPPLFTFAPRNIFDTLQTSTTEDGGISTTVLPFIQRRRVPTTTSRSIESTPSLSGRRAPTTSFTTTTETPSTSTFSVEEDLAFLKNLVRCFLT